MTSYLLPIILVLVVILLVVKFVRSLIKGIIILVVLAIALLAYNYYSSGALSSNTPITLPKIVEHQTPEQELKKYVEKLKDIDLEEAEKILQKSKDELAKYGLTVDTVKNALKELKP